ncbi:hypothetical protein PC129_g7542 [Phytophthora cactorum]|uniref:Uncharacterized protein n=2 Tax=Phytophthora cactorum TaxID=29920 RepID=A0A8T1I984_9STRA|nr:hypothetical protein PC112_g9202 [Phytophthora cactorum]KAG2828360.1 hypothetical protein PC111_g8201 [Phytophthora cactorum]KAG2858656.1 hypothetical protein PC113_g9621 [Phytophthora cactorum]KAG2909121.1 hypothetical protein PC114_g10201 [Phytophthora cactorum]KAG2924585.1 hypothetical protein PC115_g8557 [Phytophthora cactorum]
MGCLPPTAIYNPRAAHFPPPANRVHGDFRPTATHDLAAHRLIAYLTPPKKTHESPMPWVLRVRQTFTFEDSPAVTTATYSARFGRHGVSIMHYKRPAITPPPVPPCSSYFDLLSAIQGLTTFTNANWHGPFAHALYRVRAFVAANLDADPTHTPKRVERTLHEVNQFLGAAFAPLASDSPYLWHEFASAVARIEFRSVSWSIALHEVSQVAEARTPASASEHNPADSPEPCL